MLRNQGWFTLVALALISFFGCGKSDGPGQTGTPTDKNTQSTVSTAPSTVGKIPSDLEPPAAACFEFLEAVRAGNDEKASQMLSTTAREKASALNRSVTPPASDTARFSVGKVKYINEDGAQVESTWIDTDDDGQPRSDAAVWVLRREQQGWRVVGVAATIFPGEPPLVLNFEDPDDMLKKQQLVRDEIRRRTENENLQAKEPENSGNSMRR
jgi:hypothetical protein